MTEIKKTKNWWWPKITDQASAIEASKVGFFAAVMVASVTAIFTTIALATQKEIASLGVDGWSYVDVVLYSVIAWRIKRYSRLFATAGILLFVLGKILIIQAHGSVGWPLAIIILLMFINGARGVFAYHRYSNDEPLSVNGQGHR